MVIGIVGAGNIGTAIAADLGREHDIRIFSTKPNRFGNQLKYIDDDTEEITVGNIQVVSNDLADTLNGCELVFICLPTFMVRSMFEVMFPFLEKKTLVGFVPGAGGVEFFAKCAIEKGVNIFGFERVPYIARLEEYGKVVRVSKKSRYKIASFSYNETVQICKIIQSIFKRKCEPMREFVSMTLTPTLHTSRLYDLYKDCKLGASLSSDPFFYKEWTDSASALTLELDNELHRVCRALTDIGISATEIVPYSVHYESRTPEELTKKIRSIHSLQRIKGPVSNNRGVLELDLNSRYFTESFPYRLCIVKAFAYILGINIPKTDKVLLWYQELSAKEYITKTLSIGRDLIKCNVPQNIGIFTQNDLFDFYDSLQKGRYEDFGDII